MLNVSGPLCCSAGSYREYAPATLTEEKENLKAWCQKTQAKAPVKMPVIGYIKARDCTFCFPSSKGFQDSLNDMVIGMVIYAGALVRIRHLNFTMACLKLYFRNPSIQCQKISQSIWVFGLAVSLVLGFSVPGFGKEDSAKYALQFDADAMNTTYRVRVEKQFVGKPHLCGLRFGWNSALVTLAYTGADGDPHISMNPAWFFSSIASFMAMDGLTHGEFNPPFGGDVLPNLFLWPQSLTNWDFKMGWHSQAIGFLAGPITDFMYARHPYVDVYARAGLFLKVRDGEIRGLIVRRWREDKNRFSLSFGLAFK